MKPDFIFETSWEVCNKVGGIHTVVSTKAKTLVDDYQDNYILIGPDIIRDKQENSEFEEDTYILNSWKTYAQQKGLRIRVGRWKIKGRPLVVLVDFTNFFSQKDEIFEEFWKEYSLDSITGGWDYIEPCLFGYAASKVIESYYEFYFCSQDKIVSQWHEWMTGSGALYLKKNVPQIATLFTTHATVLGRCIAGNNLPLYSDLHLYDSEKISNEFNVRAKHSLESISAKQADCFTTVSQLTNNECKQFFNKEVDVVTPNGFEPEFVPLNEEFKNKRLLARERIISIAQALCCSPINEDAILIINSGRYEFKNKGIDVFINAMGQLNRSNIQKDVVAVIAVPAHNVDIYQSLLERMEKKDFSSPQTNQYLTHHLFDPENDPILRTIKENNLNNSPEDKVKIMFVPSYLNGNDGVVNLSYFDFLIGFDISVFPSYYEPWGYTPMESMAFHIPSITTTLSGYGLWIEKYIDENLKGALSVVKRQDGDSQEATKRIVEKIIESIDLNEEQTFSLREKAYDISKITLWKNLKEYYYKAYDIALQKAIDRKELYVHKQPINQGLNINNSWGDTPQWKKILIAPLLPERLSGLERLTQNLWWSWNKEAGDVFSLIDEKRFEKFNRSPIHLIESLTQQDVNRLLNDENFLKKLDEVVEHFDNYIEEGKNKKKEDEDLIAYFSMEFGLHDTLKIFSGGLGMLAGDYLKEASDSNKNIVGIGILYRYGYFSQKITKQGEQISELSPQKFSHLPLLAVRDEKGKWKKVVINLPGRDVYAKIWRCDVGRVPLYLMDTDIEDNQEQDRVITHQLYGGDLENRIKQEILLGIGGVRLLKELDINPTIYHSNEGHSAFNSLERLRNLMTDKTISYGQACEIVRSSTLFTTHTPVPAGHDTFSEDLIRAYLSHYPENLDLLWEEFIALGRMNPENKEERFSMSVLALNFAQEVNGVSKIHGRVSRQMFAPMYKGYFPSEIHIGYVTNGVHLPTWIDRGWSSLYEETFSKDYYKDQSNPKYWEKIYEVDNKKIWDTHKKAKEALVNFVLKRLEKELVLRAEDPKLFIKVKDVFSSNALTIGFARRFATYKRAHLLFTNLERLEKLVNNPEKPVQFLFAGKAHPQDKAGQDLIKSIIEISKMPQFIGKVIFIENYDMYVAKYLVRGVDLWLNTPTRPMEASGTSGEKAAINGVLNFSVLDGWWAEGYKEEAGWALSEEQIYTSNDYQNAYDAEIIYETLEDKIIPAYYNQDENNVSNVWAMYMKNDIFKIAPHFTMKRQMDDYYDKFYSKLSVRHRLLTENDNLLAREYSAWKHKMKRQWELIELIDLSLPDADKRKIQMDEEITLRLVLHINDISPEYLGAEVIVAKKENDEIKDFVQKIEMKMENYSLNRITFELKTKSFAAGVYNYSIRIFPKHPLMPHRMDFPLLKWI
ncbi:MAG: alpha-glucan family phosphorylase [Bacteroidales bacterium]|jgi:phosphorylase/glycogen(starch) synthase|nr:alpha-glucan family phosphorylase [Bacteroidales bacterium]